MKLRELLQTLSGVQKRINASSAFICGGTPRDKYMQRLDHIGDIDITTGDDTVFSLAQEFAKELQKTYNAKIKTSSDGHSTIFLGNFKMDFSSNFKVPNIKPLLQKEGIEAPTSLQEELYSRDFTCNSLLLSLDLKNIYDPTHKGFIDIKNKIIKTCLDPEITLTTNKNRVIRAIYLACKLGFEIDKSIIEYVRNNPQSTQISTENVMAEKLNAAFKHDAIKAQHYLDEMNIWNYIPITQDIYSYYLNHLKKVETK